MKDKVTVIKGIMCSYDLTQSIVENKGTDLLCELGAAPEKKGLYVCCIAGK